MISAGLRCFREPPGEAHILHIFPRLRLPSIRCSGQHYFGLIGSTALGPGKLALDARCFISDDKGEALAGPVDNRTLNVLLSYSHAGHTFGVAYQGLSGSTAMPYLIGTDADLTNYMMAADFMEIGEHTWQLRYAYDLVYW